MGAVRMIIQTADKNITIRGEHYYGLWTGILARIMKLTTNTFTAEDPLVIKWCNAEISKSDEETNTSTFWMA